MAVLTATSGTRLSALDCPLRHGTRLLVARAQWISVLEDAGVLDHAQAIVRAVVQIEKCIAGGHGSVGRYLRPRAETAVAAAERLRSVGAEVLCFRPPDRADDAPVERLIVDLSGYVSRFVVRLSQVGDADGLQLPVAAIAGVKSVVSTSMPSDRADVVRLLYGVDASQLYGHSVGTASARLRCAFADRQRELARITARVIAFAADGRRVIDPLDPGLHPLGLATDRHPWIGHHAARWACDLIHRSAALDMPATVAAVATWLAEEQAGFSTHYAVQDLWERLAEPSSPDAEVRDVANLYRAVVEGPLKVAATGTLRLLGEQVSPKAGLNDIKSRLLARRTDSPLCGAIAELIEPQWRNPPAHEQVYWDPDKDQAVLGGQPVDLDDIEDRADRAWSLGRGFQAGAAVAAGCLPAMGRLVDAAIGAGTAVARDIQLVKMANLFGLVAHVSARSAAEVTFHVESLAGAEIMTHVGGTLLGAAMLEPNINWWTVASVDDRPDFRVSAAAITVAEGLRGAVPDGDNAFLYPVTYGPLLADALIRIGLTPADAAADACGLIVADSIAAVGDEIADEVWRWPQHCRHLRRALARSVAAVHATCTYLEVTVPAELDLATLGTSLKRAEQQPTDARIRTQLNRRYDQLRHRVGSMVSLNPWA